MVVEATDSVVVPDALVVVEDTDPLVVPDVLVAVEATDPLVVPDALVAVEETDPVVPVEPDAPFVVVEARDPVERAEPDVPRVLDAVERVDPWEVEAVLPEVPVPVADFALAEVEAAADPEEPRVEALVPAEAPELEVPPTLAEAPDDPIDEAEDGDVVAVPEPLDETDEVPAEPEAALADEPLTAELVAVLFEPAPVADAVAEEADAVAELALADPVELFALDDPEATVAIVAELAPRADVAELLLFEVVEPLLHPKPASRTRPGASAHIHGKRARIVQPPEFRAAAGDIVRTIRRGYRGR